MAKVTLISARDGFSSTPTAGTPGWAPIGPCHGGIAATEASSQVVYRQAGTLSNLTINLISNTRTTASTLITRKNTANGNQSISIPASTTGYFTDSVNTDSIAAADKVNLQFTSGTGVSTMTILFMGTNFLDSTSTNTTTRLICGGNQGSNTTASSTLYYPIGGASNQTGTATESSTQFKSYSTGSLNNLYLKVVTNTSVNATTFGNRKNTANGALSLSVPANTSGFFEDTTHTETLASGDLINYYMTTVASPNIQFTLMGVDHIATDGKWMTIANPFNTVSSTFSGSGTTLTLGGNFNTGGSAGYIMQTQARLKHYQIIIRLNSLNSGTWDTAIQIKGQNDASAHNDQPAISIAFGTTGLFEDTTGSTMFLEPDALLFKGVMNGPTSGSITFQQIGAMMEPISIFRQNNKNSYYI